MVKTIHQLPEAARRGAQGLKKPKYGHETTIGSPQFCMGKRIIPIPDTLIILKVRRIHSAGGPHPLIPSPEKKERGQS